MSLAVLLSLFFTGAPPVARAEALAAKKDAEALFLEFGAVKAEDYPAAERGRVARALLTAAEAARQDPMIAVGLAEKAVVLERTAAALTLLASLEVDLGQRAAAAGHLDEALAADPVHVPALLARAELATKENDHGVAAGMYERAFAAGAKVKPQLEKARAAAKASDQAVANLKKTEAEIKTRVADATRNISRDWLKQILKEEAETSERKRLAPDGVRQQEMRNFVFSYSAGSKLAKDMFAFEGKVEKVLEKTYDFVTDKLGHRLEKRTPVILLTSQEFAEKHAGTPMSRAGGFWNGQQIVINGGSAIDERFAQVMVHEFTHVVVTDLAGHGTPPRWLNEGLAENLELCVAGLNGKPHGSTLAMLASLKAKGRLPKLGELDPLFVSMASGVEVAYGLASVAAHLLIEKRGYREYVDALREMKRTRPLQVIEKYWGTMEQIERDVADAI